MILDEIAEKTRERIAEAKKKIPYVKMRAAAEACDTSERNQFYNALRTPQISFICEVKKASPSKGVIAEHFPYLDIAAEYEAAGAAAISCLTEPYYFQGRNEYLREIAEMVSIPVLRKDFTVDAYMIYEAKTLGASAVLLICSLLAPSELAEYRSIAETLGMAALVEAHDEREIETALAAGAEIIGVNNRNLKTFTVDINNAVRLRRMVPEEVAFVAESGIRTASDIRRLVESKADAVLIGETLMKSADKKAALDRLRQENSDDGSR